MQTRNPQSIWHYGESWNMKAEDTTNREFFHCSSRFATRPGTMSDSQNHLDRNSKSNWDVNTHLIITNPQSEAHIKKSLIIFARILLQYYWWLKVVLYLFLAIAKHKQATNKLAKISQNKSQATNLERHFDVVITFFHFNTYIKKKKGNSCQEPFDAWCTQVCLSLSSLIVLA